MNKFALLAIDGLGYLIAAARWVWSTFTLLFTVLIDPCRYGVAKVPLPGRPVFDTSGVRITSVSFKSPNRVVGRFATWYFRTYDVPTLKGWREFVKTPVILKLTLVLWVKARRSAYAAAFMFAPSQSMAGEPPTVEVESAIPPIAIAIGPQGITIDGIEVVPGPKGLALDWIVDTALKKRASIIARVE